MKNLLAIIIAIFIAACTVVLFNYKSIVDISNEHRYDKKKEIKTNIDINKKNEIIDIDTIKIDSLETEYIK